MTIYDGRIDNFATGDDLEVERNISGVPAGVALTTAWLMVKRKYSDPDSKAIISKTITNSNTANVGWISDTGAEDGEGILLFYLTPAETALLTALSEYPYSIKVKLDNGKVSTPEIGVIVALPAVKQGNT